MSRNDVCPSWVPDKFRVAGWVRVDKKSYLWSFVPAWIKSLAGVTDKPDIFKADKDVYTWQEFHNMLDKHVGKDYIAFGIYPAEDEEGNELPVPSENAHILGVLDMDILKALNPKTPWEIHDEKYGPTGGNQ